MKNTLNYLSNKAICAALVVLGAFAASAELVKTPILDAENVSVGYKVTGLPNKEVAMVYTNHLRTATLRVRANLENVQFLVVGGGGGGGGGLAGPGGGGGGVVTGLVYKLEKNAIVDIKVGAGGMGGQKAASSGTVGGNSSVVVDGKSYVLAYGGGAGPRNAYGVDGGSGSGGGSYKTTAVIKCYTGGTALDAECAEGVLFAESFGHAGGSNGNSAYCSGGGGGAMGVGGDGSAAKGGAGGEGLKMDITGSLVVYGSGGGGGGNGTKGTGGTNAGDGGNNSTTDKKAGSAKANCGGGGGGGGPNNNTTGKGGNGGSGIVVLRYKEPNTSGFKIIVR